MFTRSARTHKRLSALRPATTDRGGGRRFSRGFSPAEVASWVLAASASTFRLQHTSHATCDTSAGFTPGVARSVSTLHLIYLPVGKKRKIKSQYPAVFFPPLVPLGSEPRWAARRGSDFFSFNPTLFRVFNTRLVLFPTRRWQRAKAGAASPSLVFTRRLRQSGAF